MVCRFVAPPALLVCNLHRMMAVRLQREAFSRTTLLAIKLDQLALAPLGLGKRAEARRSA